MSRYQLKFFIHIWLLAIIFFSITSFSVFAQVNSDKAEWHGNYVPGEIIVKFKSDKINIQKNAGIKSMQSFAIENNLVSDENIVSENISVMKLSHWETVEEKIKILKNDPRVDYAQPNFIYTIQSENPNDTDFDKQRWLKNIGQNINNTVGTSGVDIRWIESMEILKWESKHYRYYSRGHWYMSFSFASWSC